MRIISRRRLREFSEKHSDARIALEGWYRLAKRNDYGKFSELRDAFPTADKVGKLIVFNIGGNKYRLITAVHFNRGIIYVLGVMTHREYDRGKWKEYQ